MSQDARRDTYLRSVTDAKEADHTERRWLEGKRITREDLKRGSERIERCSAEEWWQQRQPATASAPAPNTMWFGKYKGKPMIDVMQEDPGYWAWCLREVKSFEAKARKANLAD